MPKNRFSNAATNNPLMPAVAHFNVVPSDTDDLPEVIREISIGVGGNVTVTDTSGWTGTFYNRPSGDVITGFFTRIWATGTTATSLVAGV